MYMRVIKRSQKCRYYEEMHARALMNDETALYKVYGNYSYSKEKAEERCRDMYRMLNGYKFAIITHNTFMFTVGFYFDQVDPETGEVKTYFLRITPTADECWEVPLE